MFEMRGITKSFDAVQALRGASLTVGPGKILALLGANGSGKSTMVKVLAGLVSPDSGEILIDGKRVVIRSARDSATLGIATAFQELSLISTMRVADNIMLNRETVGPLGVIDKRKDRRDAAALLDRFALKIDLDAYAQTLMPSTQSMLEVAKAVFAKPRLLLLDEVTATLHQDEVKTLFRILRETADEGTAIIYVTHRMREVARLCDAAVIMRNGESVSEVSGPELQDMDRIVFHMTGKMPEKAAPQGDYCRVEHEGAPLLEVKGLKYPPKVRDIDLVANKGEIVGIGGLEGQGQSEFIRLLLGEFHPKGGEIIYKGKKAAFRRPAEAVAGGMGFISGERNREAIFSRRTIAENIFAGRAARGKLFRYIPRRQLMGFSREAVEKYNIRIGRLTDPASSLSGGNQQKMVVARWLALMPDLLLLDDPTKGVDVNARREIHQILREYAARGMTVVISSSDNDELADLADCIYVFYEGRVGGRIAAGEGVQERLVAEMMGVASKEDKTNA
ncbi:MAG TPA: sugar ABC transporter ATP-binding protein [Candidatus Limnocylindria bacterium]|nr:sugar ABC transporter ATP-binding protein [Candidatus Limnocylindria bacterium]